MTPTFIVLTPAYRPAGGVVKIFDYVTHARSRGLPVRIHCPLPFDADLPLFQSERFAPIAGDDYVTFEQGMRIGPGIRDIVFFSWPTHWNEIATRIPADMPHERIIHVIQGTRHGNPEWIHGYGTRLLTRPMSRILVSPQVLETASPHLHTDSLHRVILEGHDWPYFSQHRSGGLGRPIRVGYTTWKSRVGIATQERLETDGRFEFRSIRDTVGWSELKELYQWADIFLATPLAEEGFYLPGLEAMAAGALVVIPDAGGNRAYCRFGENCAEVQLESADSYVSILENLANAPEAEITGMRDAAYATLEAHTLESEGAAFDVFLDAVAERTANATR